MLPEIVNKIIDLYNLKPHPEGGFYAETYRSEDTVFCPEKFGEVKKLASTSIYYLIYANNFSALHKIKSDETWNYHKGTTPVEIHFINPLTHETGMYLLGDPIEHPGAKSQITVPAGLWFSARAQNESADQYALCGCFVSPGFEFEDFELANRDELIECFPEHEAFIKKHTRASSARMMSVSTTPHKDAVAAPPSELLHDCSYK